MKNWTVKEAVKVLGEGTDIEAIKEIVSHFPMFAVAVLSGDTSTLATMIPDKVTARMLEKEVSAVSTKVVGDDDVIDAIVPDDEDEGEESVVESGDVDLTKLTVKQLIKMCDDKGIKVSRFGKNKKFYIDKLNETSGDNDEAEEAGPYDGKGALELYKLCKQRKLKVEQKKQPKYYVAKLTEADEAKADADAEEESESWDEEEVEEVEEAEEVEEKKTKNATKTTSKKKAEVVEEDDDDEWDI